MGDLASNFQSTMIGCIHLLVLLDYFIDQANFVRLLTVQDASYESGECTQMDRVRLTSIDQFFGFC